VLGDGETVVLAVATMILALLTLATYSVR